MKEGELCLFENRIVVPNRWEKVEDPKSASALLWMIDWASYGSLMKRLD